MSFGLKLLKQGIWRTRTFRCYFAKIVATPTAKFEVSHEDRAHYLKDLVGSQLYRTKTIDNDLNPVFNEYFEAVVDQASGQKLRIELFDEDRASADEELGRLTVPMESVRQAGVIDRV